MRTDDSDFITVKKSVLKAVLREVLREELDQVFTQAKSWQSDPESPLYQALIEIRKARGAGHAKLSTRKKSSVPMTKRTMK